MPGVAEVKKPIKLLCIFSAEEGLFSPFRVNLDHAIHLEHSVNLHMMISYQSFGLANMARLPCTSSHGTYSLHTALIL